MEQKDRIKAIQQQVIVTLADCGWSSGPGCALAHKIFDTVVGPKEAQVYLQDWGPTEDDLLLKGVYFSEGRNALEAHATLIPKIASTAAVMKMTLEFSENAMAVIGETYAARLLALEKQEANYPPKPRG